MVPWFVPPRNSLDITAIERALVAASQQVVDEEKTQRLSINTKQDFEELAIAAKRLTDIWSDKQLLFLLDDVSTRAMPLEDVEELLSQFSVSSTHFGFKVSTENQTIALTTQGGEPARRFRDYDYFDLGVQVLRRCAQGSKFIENVLAARTKYTSGVHYQSPKSVLGEQSLSDLATALREKQQKVYWGIEAISAMCVGDVGDILNCTPRSWKSAKTRASPCLPPTNTTRPPAWPTKGSFPSPGESSGCLVTPPPFRKRATTSWSIMMRGVRGNTRC